MLADHELQDFHEIGWIVRPAVFSAGEVDEMRRAFERLEQAAQALGETQDWRGSRFVLSRQGHAVRIQRIVWCGAAEPVLSTYGRDPRLVRPAAQLLGSSEMSQLINQAHFKLPGDGVSFPWHQDSVHRRYGRGEWEDVNGRGSYVQTVIALDDAGPDSGPLEFLPGSCCLGHVEPADEGELPPGLDASTAVAVSMQAGDVLFFGPYVFHRSQPNRSTSPRRVFINGFAYPGANRRVYPGEGSGRLVRAA